jgi:hypothetical protein
MDSKDITDEHNNLRYLQYLPTGGVKDIWIKRNGEVDVCVWLRIPGRKKSDFVPVRTHEQVARVWH